MYSSVVARTFWLLLAIPLVAACDRETADETNEEQAQQTRATEAKTVEQEESRDDAVPVATIDGETVMTQSELQERLHALVARYERASGSRETTAAWRNARRRRIVHEAVHRALVSQHIRQSGITISDAELEDTLAEKYPFLVSSEDALNRYLEARGVEEAEFYEEHRRQLALEKLLRERGRIEPSEEELRQTYERRPERWRAEERARVHTALYRVSMNATDEEVKATMKKLEEEAGAIESLEDFEEFARNNSEALNAEAGGEIGWVFRGRSRIVSDEEVDQAIFELPIEQMQGPIRTSLGAQLFFVSDRREAGVREFDEVRDVLLVPLKRQRIQELRLQLINELRQQHDIEYLQDNWKLETNGPPESERENDDTPVEAAE
jgi:parvulin-like peptidyl-prolyl isomerase